MSRLTDAVNALRRELLMSGSRAAAELFAAHKMAFDATQAQLERLLAQIAEAQKAGETLSQAWLFRQNRLEALQQQALAEMTAFARLAERRVTSEQQTAVGRSQDDAKQLAFAALEDAGRVMPAITTNWNRLPTESLTDLVGALQDGSPLRALFDDFGLQASEGMRQAMISGLATGANPREIGRNIRKVLDIGLTRAETIARTETLRAYRSASLRTYEENADVVTGWMWMASLSPRTCPMCLSMHGKKFPFTTPFGSHVNCRCAVVPVVQDASVLRTGEDWLRAQSAETQEAVLGIKAAQAWRAGDVTLEDFVGNSHSERWGTGRFTLSLEEARFKAGLRE
jgi:SPP1 gp7 family putative phage head morphogenesis protein